MASNSRLYTFINDKVASPIKIEVELNNLYNFWNNHEQGLQAHSTVWTGQFWLTPTIKTSAGTYVVSTTETLIVINKTVGAATTVTYPASPSTGRMLIVKDGKGDGAANNITLDGNGKTIDGAATVAITTNYGVARHIYNGTQWNVV